MKRIVVIFLAVCLLTIGCKSNREAFLEENIAVTDEIIRIVETNPTEENVKKAQIFLDSKKILLEAKLVKIGMGSPDKAQEEKLKINVMEQMEKLSKLSEKHPSLKKDLENLNKDYKELLLKK